MTSIVPPTLPERHLDTPASSIGELLASKAIDAVAAIRAKLDDSVQSRILAALGDERLLAQVKADTCLLPGPADREGYAPDDDIDYWVSGLADAVYINDLIKTYLGKAERDELAVFDFGCASGRVLRHIPLVRSGVVMGCDFNPTYVEFIRSYLATNTFAFLNMRFPPLPIKEKSIDFLYAISVFTHIDEFEDAWLAEIARILKPGGIAFITLHTERSLQEMTPGHFLYDYILNQHSASGPGCYQPIADHKFLSLRDFKDRLVFTRLDRQLTDSNLFQVFHHLDYIRTRWGKLFTLEDVIQQAHGQHQDGIVLRAKP